MLDSTCHSDLLPDPQGGGVDRHVTRATVHWRTNVLGPAFPNKNRCGTCSGFHIRRGIKVSCLLLCTPFFTRTFFTHAFLFPQLAAFSLPLHGAEKRPENRLPPNKSLLSTVSQGFFLFLVVSEPYKTMLDTFPSSSRATFYLYGTNGATAPSRRSHRLFSNLQHGME